MSDDPPKFPEPPFPPAPPSPVPGMDVSVDNPLGVPMLDVEPEGDTASGPQSTPLMPDPDTETAQSTTEHGKKFLEGWENELGEDACQFCRQLMRELQKVDDTTRMATGMAELAQVRQYMDRDSEPSKKEVKELFDGFEVLDDVMEDVVTSP